jgi:N-acetylneuraminic acid mutarotase
MVVFGGDSGIAQSCVPNPAIEGDTWLYDLACRSWKQLEAADGPSPRARTASAIDTASHRLYVFGGRYRKATSGAYTLYNETWVFDLTTSGWTKLATAGQTPPAVANATLTLDAKRSRLLLFGGNSSTSGASFTPSNALWALDLKTLGWSRIDGQSPQKPSARLFHAAAIDTARDVLWVHSGGDANAFVGPFLADLWAFDLAAGTWSAPAADGRWPTNRIRHTMAYDETRGRLLVFGGHDDQAMGERNDLTAFDTAQSRWSEARPGDLLQGSPRGFCDFPADFTAPDLEAPERRDGHFVGWDEGRNLFITFGGKTDCGNINDIWELDPAKNAWTRAVPAFSGESCVRSGKKDCTSLCF